MSDRKRKPILFYSNLCKYSNDIHQSIIKCNALDNFLLVNITNGKFNLSMDGISVSIFLRTPQSPSEV